MRGQNEALQRENALLRTGNASAAAVLDSMSSALMCPATVLAAGLEAVGMVRAHEERARRRASARGSWPRGRRGKRDTPRALGLAAPGAAAALNFAV